MREVLEAQTNLKIKQAEVADLIVEDCRQPSAVSHQPETTTGRVGTGALTRPAERRSAISNKGPPITRLETLLSRKHRAA
jgi:hypothetical protein